MTRFIYVLIAIACFGMFACIALAEENAVEGATVRGEIIEATAEQDPIEGVEVKIVASNGKTHTTQTDANGTYKFLGIPAGRYTISMQKDGYGRRKGTSFIVVRGGEIFDRIKMIKRDKIGQNKTKINLQRIEFLLQRVEESVAQRYKLDKPASVALRQSILQEVNTLLKEGNPNSRKFTAASVSGNLGLLELLLSYPNTKMAFAKHLTETQLQDYINFTKARRQQYREAVVQILAAFLDQVLSLTGDQRENIMKLLLDTINDKPGSDLMNIFSSTLQQGAVNFIHDKLNISLDNILNQTQGKIWQGIVDQEKNRYMFVDIVDVKTFDPPVETGKINEKSNETQEHQVDGEDNPPESQMWMLAEAVLTAHTEQLGTLNESASKRLELVTKGVIQDYIEAQNPNSREKRKHLDELMALMVAVMQQDIPREQAAVKLEAMKKVLSDQKGANKRWSSAELYNITNHPLYQQTIKDVLSEDTYTQYIEQQTEKLDFRQQASRDLIVAFINILLLLDDAQQKQLKMTAAQLTLPLLSDEGQQMMFIEFFIRMDDEILSPWQQSVFKGGR